MLGHYTHFGNLLDLLGVAVPLGTTAGRPALQRDAARRALRPTTPSCSSPRRLLDEPRDPTAVRPDQSTSAVTSEERV